MTQNRRSFIKRFGVTLGSLIASGSLPGCGPRKGKVEGDRSSNTRPLSAPEWDQVRECWLSLKTLDENGFQFEESEGQINLDVPVMKKHQRLIDALVEAGQVEAPVAEHMQMAFSEAVFHVVLSKGTCYLGIPFEYGPREDVLKQADVLRKISGGLDPATVAKAQAAIAQDVAFFKAFRAGNYAYGKSLEDDYKSGSLNASPDALEAARLLTRLFAETAG